MTNRWNAQSGFIPIGSTQWDSSWPELAEEDRLYLFSYLETRFGLSRNLFDDYMLFRKNKSWWLLKRSPMIGSGMRLKVWRVGIKAFQKVGSFIKPSTRIIQMFGHNASRAVMKINEGDLKKMAEGEFIPYQQELANGYIILSIKEKILGLGLLINGLVRSQIPRKDMRRLILG